MSEAPDDDTVDNGPALPSNRRCFTLTESRAAVPLPGLFPSPA